MKEHFKYGGPTHCILRFAKSQNQRPITISKIMDMFSHKVSKPSRAKESLDRLEKHGYISKKGDGWVITLAGSEYLRTTVHSSGGER